MKPPIKAKLTIPEGIQIPFVKNIDIKLVISPNLCITPPLYL